MPIDLVSGLIHVVLKVLQAESPLVQPNIERGDIAVHRREKDKRVRNVSV